MFEENVVAQDPGSSYKMRPADTSSANETPALVFDSPADEALMKEEVRFSNV